MSATATLTMLEATMLSSGPIINPSWARPPSRITLTVVVVSFGPAADGLPAGSARPCRSPDAFIAGPRSGAADLWPARTSVAGSGVAPHSCWRRGQHAVERCRRFRRCDRSYSNGFGVKLGIPHDLPEMAV